MTSLILIAATLIPGAEPQRPPTMEAIVLQLAQQATSSRNSLAVRIRAVTSLGNLGPQAKVAVPALGGLLSRMQFGEFPTLQEAIIVTLGKIGPAARPVVPVLTRAVGQDIDIDLAVKQSVEKIMAGAEDLEVEELIQHLKNKDASLRLRAAKSLAAKGRKADAAVPELLKLLQDPDADIRRVCVAGLRTIRPELKPTEALIQAYLLDLQDADENVRLAAARQLGRFGQAASAALTPLQKVQQTDPDTDVRRAASEALARIVP